MPDIMMGRLAGGIRWASSKPASDPSGIMGSDLVTWYRGDDVTLGTSPDVSQLNDKSGNGNHATQSTDTRRPHISTELQNGHDGVVFDGVDDYFDMGSDYTTEFKTGELCFTIAFRLTDGRTSNFQAYFGTINFGGSPTGACQAYNDVNGTITWYLTTSIVVSITEPNYFPNGTTDFVVMTFQADEHIDDDMTIRADTVEVADGSISAINMVDGNLADAGNMVLGARNNDGSIELFSTMELLELCIYTNNDLSKIEALENYMITRYAL